MRILISFLYRWKLKLERFSNFSGPAMLSTKLIIIIALLLLNKLSVCRHYDKFYVNLSHLNLTAVTLGGRYKSRESTLVRLNALPQITHQDGSRQSNPTV